MAVVDVETTEYLHESDAMWAFQLPTKVVDVLVSKALCKKSPLQLMADRQQQIAEAKQKQNAYQESLCVGKLKG